MTVNPLANWTPEHKIVLVGFKDDDGKTCMSIRRLASENDADIINHTSIRLDDFKKYGYGLHHMNPTDPDVKQEHNEWVLREAIAGRPIVSYEAWFVQQPVILELTDGKRTIHYRVSAWNFFSLQPILDKILEGAINFIAIEDAKANSQEQPHVVEDTAISTPVVGVED